MRLLLITAGAGGMYCGSCLRDNALATELMAGGHDVTLLPIYTPTLTDEPNVSEARVLFGGVSVYLEQHIPLFRRTPAILDRLWDSGPVIRALAGRSVSVDPATLGDLTVSTLRGEEGFQAKEIAKLTAWLAGVAPFDAIVLPNALLLGLAPALKRASGAPVCVTLQGEDLFLDALAEPHRSEAHRLIRSLAPSADAFLSVSRFYSDHMAHHLGIPRDRIHTVPLGITLAGHGPVEAPHDRPFTLGYFARVAPEKGLHLLAEVYRRLRQEHGLPASRLEVAGYLARDQRPYLSQIEESLGIWGLGGEFSYRGVLDREQKVRFLRGLDVLCVPSPYREPKGLYLLEGLANGVPAVSPRHGAFPELLEGTGGGLLAEPDDPASFAARIAELWRDPALRRRLGLQGAEAVRRLHGADRMARRTLEVLERLVRECAGGRPAATA